MAIQIKKVLTIAINAEAFIIPNTPVIPALDCGVDINNPESWWNQYMIPGIAEFCQMNGRTFDPMDPLFEIWLSSNNDLGCENLEDHYPSIEIDGVSRVFKMKNCCRFPAKMLTDIKEGDVVTFNIPAYFVSDDKNGLPAEDFVLQMNIRFAQREFRYRRFGNFEDCYQMKLNDSKVLYARVSKSA